MLLSICIPCYNCSQYIEECIESICIYRDKSIEVICVNDGSTDDTLDKLNVLQSIYRIKVISTENKGLASARNTCLSYCNGECVYFLDSDDIFNYKIYYNNKNLLRCYKYDIIMFAMKAFTNHTIYYENVERYNRLYMICGKYPFRMNGETALFTAIKNDDYRESVCGKIYSRKFIEDNNLEFAIGRLHEDNFYTYNAFLRASSVHIAKEILQLRRVRDDSIMSRKKTHKNVVDLLFNYEQMKIVADKFLKQQNQFNIKPIINTKAYAKYIYNRLSSEEQLKVTESIENKSLLYSDFLYEAIESGKIKI